MNPLDILELKHTMAGIADLLASYREALIVQGFTPAEALAVVIAYQASLFAVPPKGDG